MKVGYGVNSFFKEETIGQVFKWPFIKLIIYFQKKENEDLPSNLSENQNTYAFDVQPPSSSTEPTNDGNQNKFEFWEKKKVSNKGLSV